jgi:hypothetical protein
MHEKRMYRERSITARQLGVRSTIGEQESVYDIEKLPEAEMYERCVHRLH